MRLGRFYGTFVGGMLITIGAIDILFLEAMPLFVSFGLVSLGGFIAGWYQGG